MLPRRSVAGTFGGKGGFLSENVAGLCIYIKEGKRGELMEAGGDGSASYSPILFACDKANYRIVAVDAFTGALIRTVYGDGSQGSGFNQLRPSGISLLAPSKTSGLISISA